MNEPLTTRPAPPMRPMDIYQRAADEGRERAQTPLLGLVSRAFIAGFNIVFGILALGIVHALVAERFGSSIGDIFGSLAFGLGLVLLVIGRSELFSENFLDPVAAAVQDGGRMWFLLGRLWIVTLVVNLVGGAVLCLLMSVRHAIPDNGAASLVLVADEIVRLPSDAAFVRAIAAGAILTLMTWLLQAASAPGSRIVIAWAIGAFVAIGPFNHVIVTELHLLIGHLHGAEVAVGDYLSTLAIATSGNLIGGLVFVTLTHLGQVKGGSPTSQA